MKKTLFILFIFTHIVYSQQEPGLYSKLKNSFVAFEYEKTIALANEMLLSKDSLADDILVEVLRMQAIAYFSLDDLTNAEISFTKVLEIRPNFTLNESETSPKIISFYDKIKLDYLSEQMNHNSIDNKKDQDQVHEMQQTLAKYKAGMLRSLVLPGWGHYYVDQSDKALLLNIASLLTLAPGVYYAIQTEKYERDYLNESYEKKIESSYRKYNNAYKNRNYFLAAYSIVWLYAQYDYFFSDHMGPNSNFFVTLGSDAINHSPQIQFYITF